MESFNLKEIAIRCVIIIIAFALAYASYGLLNRTVLEPRCLTNTSGCHKVQYYQLENSVLGQVLPANYYFWFNGRYVYVYRQPTGFKCENPERYESVFTVELSTGSVLGYECVRKLEDVLQTYITSAPVKYLYIRPDPNKPFDLNTVLNAFLKEGIIHIPTSS